MKILVTGGPVHGKLDPVKIITNRFRGGLMTQLVERLLPHADVTYLTARGATVPTCPILYHDGIHDYMDRVKELADRFDAVVLGAAVANLIPAEPMTTKFPSHNYKPGDIIPINFTIAPRIIDVVKEVAPLTKLFGFKLLTGVPEVELINAAYGILLESKATAVFANDTSNLKRKLIVTRERGVIESDIPGIADFILDATKDEYYRTRHVDAAMDNEAVRKFGELAALHLHRFQETPEGYVFGTIAVRDRSGGFVTTGRGKNELEDMAYVSRVVHEWRSVEVVGDRKATLNAPLLDRIFRKFNCEHIVHWHREIAGAPTLPYAPAGTVRDAEREIPAPEFNIKGHGAFMIR